LLPSEHRGEDFRQWPRLGRLLGVVEDAELAHGALQFRGVLGGQIDDQCLGNALVDSAEQLYALHATATIVEHDQPRPLLGECSQALIPVPHRGQYAGGDAGGRQTGVYLTSEFFVVRN
jgi:hypothetical protein